MFLYWVCESRMTAELTIQLMVLKIMGSKITELDVPHIIPKGVSSLYGKTRFSLTTSALQWLYMYIAYWQIMSEKVKALLSREDKRKLIILDLLGSVTID